MTTSERQNDVDPEFDAMRVVYLALKDLDVDSQNRVLDYVLRRLSLTREDVGYERAGSSFSPRELAHEVQEEVQDATSGSTDSTGDELEGISPIAQKWIRRNGLTVSQLSRIFSLGIDDIDLVTKSISGKNKKEKMRKVILLVGVAAYLGSGVARVTHDAIKEALGHYNAYDVANFAAYMKDLASEVTGSKEEGYQLTQRGLASGAEIVNELTATK